MSKGNERCSSIVPVCVSEKAVNARIARAQYGDATALDGRLSAPGHWTRCPVEDLLEPWAERYKSVLVLTKLERIWFWPCGRDPANLERLYQPTLDACLERSLVFFGALYCFHVWLNWVLGENDPIQRILFVLACPLLLNTGWV